MQVRKVFQLFQCSNSMRLLILKIDFHSRKKINRNIYMNIVDNLKNLSCDLKTIFSKQYLFLFKLKRLLHLI